MMSAALVEWAIVNLRNKKAQPNRQYQQLSQLTIVIPSFCRQEYLLRQLVYWAFSEATIIIVDGSPVPLEAKVIDLISGVPNVQYFSINDSYTNRIREACKYIKTPYAMCLADDDMFLMEGLSSAVDQLNQDSGVVVCMGQIIGIDYDHKKMRTHIFPYGDSLENYQVRHQDPVRRVQLGIDSYRTATSYAVFRAATFSKVWHSLQMTSCLEATEYEHAIATYTLGSLSTVSHVYWLRSFECEPIDSVIDGTRKTDFHAWWTGKEYQQEQEALVSRLASNLATATSLSEENSRKEINRVINYILVGRHTGLMNENRSIMVLALLLKVVKYFSFLHKYFIKFKSSNLGGVIRNSVMANIRGASVDPYTGAKSEIADQTAIELKEILLFITSFHAAQIRVAK